MLKNNTLTLSDADELRRLQKETPSDIACAAVKAMERQSCLDPEHTRDDVPRVAFRHWLTHAMGYVIIIGLFVCGC